MPRKASPWSRPKIPASPPTPAAQPAGAEAPRRWLRALVLAGAMVVLLAGFSHPFGDADGWWHLKTGQYIVQQHRLPVPDPFSFTTDLGKPLYPDEPMIRHFNLTHEWLSQAIFYAAYAVGGFGGVVALRMLLLFAFCVLVGLLAYRRAGEFYWAVAAGLAAADVIAPLAVERPHIITYVLLAATLLILERGRPLWLLPPLFLFWSNCHGGFVLGWVALGGYCAQAVWLRWRGRPAADERRLWWVTACSVAVTGLNPNGFRIFQVLAGYHGSSMQAAILEWQPPHCGELSVYTVLLYAGALSLMWARRRARLVDWLLFALFAAASISALRNGFLIAILGPAVIAAYFPWKRAMAWVGQGVLLALVISTYLTVGGADRWVKALAVAAALAAVYFLAARGRTRIAETGVAVVLAWAAYVQSTSPGSFRFIAGEDFWPQGAADFMLAHHITGRMLNNYHQGGYLIWKLWPQERVFIDGRALNETAFHDAFRMITADSSGGKDPAQLLNDYGIEVILMSGIEFVTGQPYPLTTALTVMPNTEWKLVYQDHQGMIFMRHPPPDVKPLNKLDGLVSLENQCQFHMQFYRGEVHCAQGLSKLFRSMGDDFRTRRWLRAWVERKQEPDPDAERAYRIMMGR
ncbi:MAG TPA: hypothetical protein VKF41_02885 [Bryobacteraceae bacterium]|nr:hypothetical protein [Bryobacteraceae bacterium]